MKSEARVAILVSNDDTFYVLCVFRGFFIEKLFLSLNKEELISEITSSPISEEIRYSNLGIGEKYTENQLENLCRTVALKLSEKLNINK
ncbi:DNA-directed RNA polymerase subunit M [Sulfolobus sp. A20]|uniref:DNA-directed RNA polymerase subunit M n=1 Tax=Saccharolobus sp. A20 TaxID=1891280 RepID=UPI00084620FB|nr:DNA-directed RNA polymerase subunit M [Sulfolobus sp. A20]TRM75519.1 DNA-directed RNA polymerase subunit M [Sulfolobus sp. A20-N-F8]TRM79304.1 DNA-directed RNA polymerase subunit M [Sulfolobus sp. B5]TRM82162.1 DNA-directed RNA polymerase subunit M [Sulfolobus sp. D5]TRM88531.1 DNA-directed RNA polymerase subunit M [Sulfolobus sp. E3]TRM97693.1 DNA-directed RNA polymerase subunit M [Sulfolobus sp. F1]